MHVHETTINRRRDPRAPLEGVLANKFIDGYPYVVEILDASKGGFAIRRIHEPETDADTFALELSLGGPSFFAWAKRVRRDGDRESYRLLSIDVPSCARMGRELHALGA